MAQSKQVPLSYCLHFAMMLFLVMMIWLKVNDKQVNLPFASVNSGQAASGSTSSVVLDDWLADSSY